MSRMLEALKQLEDRMPHPVLTLPPIGVESPTVELPLEEEAAALPEEPFDRRDEAMIEPVAQPPANEAEPSTTAPEPDHSTAGSKTNPSVAAATTVAPSEPCRPADPPVTIASRPAPPAAIHRGPRTVEDDVAEAILSQRSGVGSTVIGLVSVGEDSCDRNALRRIAAAAAERLGSEVPVVDIESPAIGEPSSLDALRRQHSIVLVAIPPPCTPASISTLGRCDGAYLCVELGVASRRAVLDASNDVRGMGVRLLGCLAIERRR